MTSTLRISLFIYTYLHTVYTNKEDQRKWNRNKIHVAKSSTVNCGKMIEIKKQKKFVIRNFPSLIYLPGIFRKRLSIWKLSYLCIFPSDYTFHAKRANTGVGEDSKNEADDGAQASKTKDYGLYGLARVWDNLRCYEDDISGQPGILRGQCGSGLELIQNWYCKDMREQEP